MSRPTKISERLRGDDVQSVLISKSIPDSRATRILRAHGLRRRIDRGGSKAKFNRFRQRDPIRFKPGSLRTVATGLKGVKAIVGARNTPKPNLDLMRPFG